MAAKADNALRWAIAFIVALTAYRVVMHTFNATDLFVDEAQYWAWGQNLDWGYFSKPPVIGWLLRGVTDLVGSDAGFWVRAPAPVLHGITACLILAAARQFYDDWVAAWAACLYLAMPLVTAGSALMSTDTVMLPFFALAFWMYGRLVAQPSWRDAAILGLAVGLGMMGKYAMMYFAICACLVALFQPTARIRLGEALLAGLIALLVFAPNIWWNIDNGGTTVRHVVEDNASWDGFQLHLDEVAIFLISQAAIFGPILFVAVLIAGIRAATGRVRGPDLTLVLFCLPIIAFVTGQALMSRAYANWAATAYVAAPILAAALLQYRRRLLVLSQALNLLIALALPAAFAMPYAITTPDGEPLLRRYLGRAEMTSLIADATREAELDVIVASNRDLLADMVYRLNDSDLSVFAAPPKGLPKSFYEQAMPYEGDGPFAFVGRKVPCNGTFITRVTGSTGQWKDRHFNLYEVSAPCG